MPRQVVGVIAEDSSDADVVRVLVRRICGEGWTTIRGVGRGCATARKKAARWLNQFATRGVSHTILLHDLDRSSEHGQLNDEDELRRRLDAIPVPSGMRRLICIPVEELEAWFWASPEVLGTVARRPKEAHPNPHLIRGPKEQLMVLSRDPRTQRARYSTNENKHLAEVLDLDACAERCPSFVQLRDFLKTC